MNRRIAHSVVLLFCSSLGWSQVTVNRALFRDGKAVETMPPFIAKMQDFPGAARNLTSDGSTSFLEESLSANVRLAMEESSGDTTGVETTSMKIDSGSTRKSPGLAILMSMVIPGSGQIYVHRYITIPIIWGFGYYFVKAWIEQNNQYVYYRDLFTASVVADTVNHQGNGLYQSNRDFYRDDRDKFTFYLAITYILNIVDAYVGASLYSFDVSNNLGGSAAIRLRIPIQ